MKKILLLPILLLFVSETNAQITLTIRSKPTNSTFGYIVNASGDPGSHSTVTSMVIADWTSSGTPYNWRSLLKFNLSAIPAGSIIDSAFLSLYANPSSPSGNPGNPTWGTNNAVGIYRLTGTWDTGTLTWATQPAFSTTNSDTLPQSTSTVQDYLNVNVTDLVKDAYTLGNYGFLFKHLQETTPLNSMIFYSPNYATTDSNKTPKLVIKYRNTLGITNMNNDAVEINIYPNPATTLVNISTVKQTNEQLFISLSDITGRVVAMKTISDNTSTVNINIGLSNLAKGLYFLKVQNGNGSVITRKLIVE